MPGIGSIDEGKCQRVKASRKYLVARRRNIARVFVSNDSRCETCRLERYTLCERVAVVPPESFSALSPFRWILRSPFARRVRHANACTKCLSREDARITIRLAHVVAKLALDAGRLGRTAEGLCRARGILGPRMNGEQQNNKT